MLRLIMTFLITCAVTWGGAWYLTSSGWSDAVSLIIPICGGILVFLLLEPVSELDQVREER